ncbi:hypothetical protein ACOSP7_016138 [Xanthoceras sorbifolium]
MMYGNEIADLSYLEPGDCSVNGQVLHTTSMDTNSNGSIKLKEGQVFSNAKLTRAAVKGYAIQEGFRLKKIKNGSCRYTITCKNDTYRFGVRCDRQTLYRAKKIILKTMKANHIDSYFLRLLHEPLDWNDDQPIYFMSDHQKGGLAALRKEWAKAINQYYFRHMLANFKCAFKNHKLNASWRRFDRYCQLVNVRADEKWARHAFDSRIKFNHVTNNMSECFNRWIKDERDKPILTLLELGEWYETLEPCGKKKLVNTDDVHCECGMWQISRIPCMHVIVVFMYNRQFAHEHVHWYYSKKV